MQQALQRHAAAFLSAHRPDAVQRTVLNRLLACRTAALGGHLYACKDCGWQQPRYNSCKDRHCGKCQGKERARWLEDQQRRMLTVSHFQVVFTLPGQLRPVALRNPALVYAAMFEAAAHVLQTLAHQNLGALLGVTAVLHTWASDLRHHPHVHCLVTAGGLLLDRDVWVHTKPDFLFYEGVMAAMFKGRLMATLRAAHADGTLHPPGDDAARLRTALRDARRKRVRWVVHVEAPNGRDARFAARYLARYARGVAIADARVLAVDDTSVIIATKTGRVSLDGPEFVRRFLLHVLPPDFRKIRHYGLYAPGEAVRVRERAAKLLEPASLHPPHLPDEPDDGVSGSVLQGTAARAPRCPSCGGAIQCTTLPSTRPGIRWAPLPRGPP